MKFPDYYFQILFLKLTLLFALFLWAFLTACFSKFIEFCIEKPGRIFFPYKLWLAKNALRRESPALLKTLTDQHKRAPVVGSELVMKHTHEQSIITNAEPLVRWEKAAGYCVYCFNVWVCFITFWFTGIQEYFSTDYRICLAPIFFVVVSNFFLRKMN